jgi:hypothetical protein
MVVETRRNAMHRTDQRLAAATDKRQPDAPAESVGR